MKLRKSAAIVLILSWLMLGGCNADVQEDNTLERSTSALFIWEASFFKNLIYELVGRGLNGMDLNGNELDGEMVISVSLQDVIMPKGAPKDLSLNATLFRGKHPKAKALGGKDISGALFSGSLSDGAPISLRVDQIDLSEEPGEPYYKYKVSYQSQEGWLPLCGTDAAGEAIAAIPLNGVWSYEIGSAAGGAWFPSETEFTFACEGFILAKCVSMGYKPWSEGRICEEGGNGGDCVKATLSDHHLACVRALRADYCGDGTSFTEDGILINLFDGIGIRVDSDPWILEAEWDADGARCISSARLPALPLPSCLSDLVRDDCGDLEHFATGTLIMTEVEDSVVLP